MQKKVLLRPWILLVLAFFPSLIMSCAGAPTHQNCEEVRAAFDIGSGSTKVMVARFDFCKNQVLARVWDGSAAVAYQESLGSTKTFDEATRTKGRAEFLRLMQEAVKQGAVRAAGVATHAFREARDGESFLRELEKESLVPTGLRVISQEAELQLGYDSAIVSSETKSKNVIVWDIGGGSQQMSMIDLTQPQSTATQPAPPAKLLGYKSDYASTNFMNTFPLKELSGKKTPNPIGDRGTRKGLERAQKTAKDSVPAIFRNAIRKADTEVLGIGGVLSKSVRAQVGKNPFTAADIYSTLEKKKRLTDSEIGGDYANTQVSNLILVLGFMKDLGITKVHAVDGNLSTGILVNQSYWKSQ